MSQNVYVPRCYDVTYADDGSIGSVVPNEPGIPFRVRKHTLMDLDQWPYPAKPLVPLAETVHERFSVEIFRGCTRGCRFCQAGMITRPVRERSIETIGAMVEKGIRASGFEEVGLLSLSSADHTEIAEVATGLADRYVRVTGKADRYHERFRSRSGLVRMLAGFTVWDYTYSMLSEPDRFAGDSDVPGPVAALPIPVLRALRPIVPTFLWVATKQDAAPAGAPLASPPARVR